MQWLTLLIREWSIFVKTEIFNQRPGEWERSKSWSLPKDSLIRTLAHWARKEWLSWPKDSMNSIERLADSKAERENSKHWIRVMTERFTGSYTDSLYESRSVLLLKVSQGHWMRVVRISVMTGKLTKSNTDSSGRSATLEWQLWAKFLLI